MVEISYKAGSLFDAPKGSLLLHACNAQGVWGRGIAAEFKRRFPSAYGAYNAFCRAGALAGSALIVDDGDYLIGCLITSSGYLPPDDPKTILAFTRAALKDLQEQYEAWNERPDICSNRFNSGLFHVPWTRTAHEISGTWTATDTWTVYEG